MQRLDIHAIDGLQVIVKGDFWKIDIHWHPSGHKKIGEMLAQFLSKAGAEKGTIAAQR